MLISFHFDHGYSAGSFQYKLCNGVAFLEVVSFRSCILQAHHDFAPVIWVDRLGIKLDVVVYTKRGARSDSSMVSLRDSNFKARSNFSHHIGLSYA